MIRIIKRGTPPEQLLHYATCNHCGTEYEFTHNEAVPCRGRCDGDYLKPRCPVCKRDVFSADDKGRPISYEETDPPLE